MGRPAPGYVTRLVDENGGPVAPGGIGQIVVRGEPGLSLMKGYYRNPEATAETIRDGWLWSGGAEGQAATGLTRDAVIDWCAQRLARFRVPDFVRFRAELPRTAVGKVQKHVLRAEIGSGLQP